MTSSTPLVWFITACSSGIGAALAIHILRAGHQVIATARNPSSAASFSEIKSLGGHWLAPDVNSPTAGTVLADSAKIFGRIDVLANNAGYSILGVVEDIRSVFISIFNLLKI
jgi:NAD(P)-dependent dehydrogenase (short-subunit alcohol dehydrogenase family)